MFKGHVEIVGYKSLENIGLYNILHIFNSLES